MFPECSNWILSDFCCHHEQTVCSENVRELTSSPSSIRCLCKPYTNFRKCSRTWWCRVSFCPRIYPREEDFNREEFDASVALQVWPGGTSSPRISSDGSWATFPPSAPLSNHMKKWLIGQRIRSTATIQDQQKRVLELIKNLISDNWSQVSREFVWWRTSLILMWCSSMWTTWSLTPPSPLSACRRPCLIRTATARWDQGTLKQTIQSFLLFLSKYYIFLPIT